VTGAPGAEAGGPRHRDGRPLLVVTAVAAERDAVAAGWPGEVHVVGVGVAAAAAATARLLALGDHRAVLCAGIGGGFAGRIPVGGTAIATASVAADLGAESPDGFLPLSDLGFGPTAHAADPALRDALCAALDATAGPILTVHTVTGTAESTTAITARHPDAVAEGMEGFGVATAAAGAGLAFGEVRTISNLVGPRDRAGWRIPDALAALTELGRALVKLGW
jgi:futalosine hydrolase